MKKSILLATLILALWPGEVSAHWDDDTWVDYQRSQPVGEFADEWDSLLELECFVALELPDRITIWLERDCDDWARRAQLTAMKWHRILETEMLTPYEMKQQGYQMGKFDTFQYHYLNKAFISGKVYYIEPQYGLHYTRVWESYELD